MTACFLVLAPLKHDRSNFVIQHGQTEYRGDKWLTQLIWTGHLHTHNKPTRRHQHSLNKRTYQSRGHGSEFGLDSSVKACKSISETHTLQRGVPTKRTTDHHPGRSERKELKGRTRAQGCEKMALWEWEACPSICLSGGGPAPHKRSLCGGTVTSGSRGRWARERRQRVKKVSVQLTSRFLIMGSNICTKCPRGSWLRRVTQQLYHLPLSVRPLQLHNTLSHNVVVRSHSRDRNLDQIRCGCELLQDCVGVFVLLNNYKITFNGSVTAVALCRSART